MATSDQIADFLTRIRNSSSAQHRYVDVAWCKLRQSMAEILKEKGFIESYLVKLDTESRGTIRLFLKYTPSRKPMIKGLKRVSKPGLRKFVGYEDIPMFFGGLGVSIVSTSHGVMDGREAKRRKVGGELLCMVW